VPPTDGEGHTTRTFPAVAAYQCRHYSGNRRLPRAKDSSGRNFEAGLYASTRQAGIVEANGSDHRQRHQYNVTAHSLPSPSAPPPCFPFPAAHYEVIISHIMATSPGRRRHPLPRPTTTREYCGTAAALSAP